MPNKLPPHIAQKWEAVKSMLDPVTNNPIVSMMRDDFYDPTPNPQGGVTCRSAHGGALVTSDNSNRPPLLVYGPIYEVWAEVGGAGGGFGLPLSEMQRVPTDGSFCVVFEGGHIHRWGDQAEAFPPDQCAAPYKPQPPYRPFGFPGSLPTNFQQKWSYLVLVKDPSMGNHGGGETFDFHYGWMVTSSDTPGVEPFAVYKTIYDAWSHLGSKGGGLGMPISDERDIPGVPKGRCQPFEFGHIHKIDDAAVYIHPGECSKTYPALYQPPPLNRPTTGSGMPPNFQRKWTYLLTQKDPYQGEVVAKLLTSPWGGLDDLGNGSQVYAFLAGAMISLGPGSEPFVIWGAILKLWEGSGGRNGKFGRPIMDEKELSDGGRCQQFQKPSGFHIHKYNGVAKEVPARQCPINIQPATQVYSPSMPPNPQYFAHPQGIPPPGTPSQPGAYGGYQMPPPPALNPHSAYPGMQNPNSQYGGYNKPPAPQFAQPTFHQQPSYSQPPPPQQNQQQTGPKDDDGCLAQLKACCCPFIRVTVY